MSISHRAAIALAILIVGVTTMPLASAGTFEDLGIPVTKGTILSTVVGPDDTGKMNCLYLNFNQDGAPFFSVQVNVTTGQVRQFNAPRGHGPWGGILGPDNKVYFGTCGLGDDGAILRFDPAHPDKGIEFIGRPVESETYIWMFTNGRDDCIYGCTYGNAKLVQYNTKTGALRDVGRMDDTQMYSRSVATGKDGRIYVGIGMAVANIVCYDPATDKHWSVVPQEHRVQDCGQVWNGKDGNAYGRIGKWLYRLDEGKATLLDSDRGTDQRQLLLADGRIVTATDYEGRYTLVDPKTGAADDHTFTYAGAGSVVFQVGAGPGGKVYGSSAMPCEMFQYDPATGKSADLGNPCGVGGEIYSFQTVGDKLYACAYPGSSLAVYDPGKRWDVGRKPANNPYIIGDVGDGHLRPRAMILGGDGRLYIGSHPPYGQLGGALGIVDPATNRVVENYRHIVTNQAITALAWDTATGLVYGGSGIFGGGGSTPVEKEARLFVFDPARKAKTSELVPVPGDTQVSALASLPGKLFGISHPSNTLFVFDTHKAQIVHRAAITCGSAREVSLGLDKAGALYGLTDQGVIRIAPDTYAVTLVARSPVPVTSGFALTDTGVYFGSGVHLWRYRW